MPSADALSTTVTSWPVFAAAAGIAARHASAGAGVEFLAEHEVVRLSVVGTNLLNMRYRDYNSLLRYFADEPGWGLQLRLAVDFDVPVASEV